MRHKMTVNIDKRRKKYPIRPLKAVRHMRRLLADKEDTEQVFHIMQALNGNSAKRKLRQISKSSEGAAMLDRRRELPAILDDHETLEKLPEKTVGRAYVNFMQREGLTAAGLVEESEKWWQHQERFDDDLEYFARRMRDTHDLYHVLTGYGRDELGEVSVLGFSHAHNGGLGNLFIAFVGARDVAKTAPEPKLIHASLREARKNGRAANMLATEDIVALLSEPIEAARKRMNIAEPLAYKAALTSLRDTGYEGALSAA